MNMESMMIDAVLLMQPFFFIPKYISKKYQSHYEDMWLDNRTRKTWNNMNIWHNRIQRHPHDGPLFSGLVLPGASLLDLVCIYHNYLWACDDQLPPLKFNSIFQRELALPVLYACDTYCHVSLYCCSSTNAAMWHVTGLVLRNGLSAWCYRVVCCSFCIKESR